MKKIPYGCQNITEDDINAVISTLKNPNITQGPKIGEFENKLAKYNGSKYAVVFSNGTAALHAAYNATGITDGDEFITTPITFAASANAGLYCGAIPKFVDIDMSTYNIDIKKLELAVSKKTKVITPVAYFGNPVNMKKVREIADKNGCYVIYDCAHAIGALYNKDKITKYADLTILSFHPVKHITTGEGGAVLTNDENLYKKLILFRSHGITKDPAIIGKNKEPWVYDMVTLGYNYRITDIQCALGCSQLERIDTILYLRNKIAKKYNEMLKNIDWITLPPSYDLNWVDDEKYNNLKNYPEFLNSYHLYPILLDKTIDREKFYNYMHENGILVQIHYKPVHTLGYYKENFGYKKGDFPIAEDFYNREVSLPMFPTLTDEDIKRVVDIIKNFK